MRTASIRELRHDLSRVLAWVADGDVVVITKRRQTVARLVPVNPRKHARAKMPDITACLRKVFGAKVISDRAMTGLFGEIRGRY